MKESTKKKILIIEDEVSQRKALVDKFIREGFSVLEARDGEEGLRVALKEQPNIILLDIIMPKMDGMTVMKKLRQENEWGKKVPIILLTNLSSDDDKTMNRIKEDSPAYYLVKANLKIGDLVEKVKEQLARET